MKFKIVSVVVAVALLASCSDSTDSIGSSLSEEIDAVNVETATFNVASRSILADSVLSRSNMGYLGKIRDPETDDYITGDFMAQFYCLEDFAFPAKSRLVAHDDQGNELKGVVKADSCQLRLFYGSQYGDSTATMKLTAYEMGKAMNEDREYYSNFDPLKNGYIRNDGIHKDKVYSLTDYMVAESTRDTSTYEPYITINLNDPYTDADGKTYNNYGTYVMEKYYENPSFFKNAWTFRNNVVPGFYFKHKAGLGSMAYIDASQLDVYYSVDTGDTVVHTVDVFWGTEEVLQKTNFTNDKATLTSLVNDNSCTYLKTPSGIFTELTLPVEDIMRGREQDKLAGVSLSIPRINNTASTDYTFDVPSQVLMVPKDSLFSFFENSDMYDNKTSYLATWSAKSTSNAYTFNNIANLVSTMAAIDPGKRTADWNKVVLVPVSVTTTSNGSSSANDYYSYYYGYSSYGSTSSSVTKVAHDMAPTSTRLAKGTSVDSPLKLEVIYSRFK